MDILKTPIPQSVLDSIGGYIQNELKTHVTSGVFVVRVNGNIDRFDNISNTPIQDAINSANLFSTGVADYVWCNNWNGFSVGKMEQNIIIKNYVNIRFDGSNIFSNSTDNTPLFTDGGYRASIVITGNPILGRYGGSGDNNRSVFELQHPDSYIRSNAYMVIDSTQGSSYSIISKGNIYLAGDSTIAGGIKTLGGTYYITSTRGVKQITIDTSESYSDFTFSGSCENILISGSGDSVFKYIGTNNTVNSITQNTGEAYISNVNFIDTCGVSTSANTVSVYTDCSFNALGGNNFNLFGTLTNSSKFLFKSCRFETDDLYNFHIDASHPNLGKIIFDNCKFIGANSSSIYSVRATNVVNYNSYATINKNSDTTLLVDTLKVDVNVA